MCLAPTHVTVSMYGDTHEGERYGKALNSVFQQTRQFYCSFDSQEKEKKEDRVFVRNNIFTATSILVAVTALLNFKQMKQNTVILKLGACGSPSVK